MARVLLFGRLATSPAGASAASIRRARHPLGAEGAARRAETPALGAALAGTGVQAAVDKAIVRGDVALAAGAEVAFLPPMSGG